MTDLFWRICSVLFVQVITFLSVALWIGVDL